PSMSQRPRRKHMITRTTPNPSRVHLNAVGREPGPMRMAEPRRRVRALSRTTAAMEMHSSPAATSLPLKLVQREAPFAPSGSSVLVRSVTRSLLFQCGDDFDDRHLPRL